MPQKKMTTRQWLQEYSKDFGLYLYKQGATWQLRQIRGDAVVKASTRLDDLQAFMLGEIQRYIGAHMVVVDADGTRVKRGSKGKKTVRAKAGKGNKKGLPEYAFIRGSSELGMCKVEGWTGQYNYVNVRTRWGERYIVPDALLRAVWK